MERQRSSYGWRSVLHGRSLLLNGLTKMIGDGASINVWSDPWIGDENPRIPLMKNMFINLNLKVSDLIHRRSGLWNIPILKDLLYQQDINLILKKSQLLLKRTTGSGNITEMGITV